jgi:hypothetical protein
MQRGRSEANYIPNEGVLAAGLGQAEEVMLMKATRCVAGIFVIVLAGSQIALAKTDVLTLKWNEVEAAVANREVTVVLAGNVRLTGAVREFQPDALVMTVRKTSDRNAHPTGDTSIPRREVVEIRIKEVSGPGRLIVAAGAGTASGLGSLPWALSESRVNVSDQARAGQWAAITAGATVGGYLIGWMIDTKHTIIKVALED